ncbi:hypothetical protein RN001_014854 [Aquatica leii]|uniref:Serine/threonine-protein phosphatase n=1 Tax=Aquatica leii TaxID=1421715 RepID=A0AAN7PYV9_9COLE|nr:hypothetical protein RN001_014854 [Aquatica leii]
MCTRKLDSIIAHLLWCSTRSAFDFNLSENEIQGLCFKSIKVLLEQPMLLKIDAPVIICGDIHGHFYELATIFKKEGYPPQENYLFLGDYVDRGKRSIETACLLLAYKVKYPNNFYVLRGNHECAQINRDYGFYDECVERYSAKLWKVFNHCFNCLPVAAIVSEKIFCCHGGLSPHLEDLDQISNLKRPTKVPRKGLLCDLLWSDPNKDITGWTNSHRGVSFMFGEDVVHEFLHKHNLKLICRAHEVAYSGYKFFANRKLVTVFSVPDYCGGKNDGAVMFVDNYLVCTFRILKKGKRS